MKPHPAAETGCPLAAVDQRLADAHRLWHQAEAAYFDPDGFRLAVQNTIQTLRTVTFIVQKNKDRIPDFDIWYGKWQDRLRGDPLMVWMVDARNRIEKQGDLAAHSFVRAELLASHLDEGPRIEVPAHLFESPEVLFRSIPNDSLGQHILRNGALRIQRRWIENSLPDYELLDAVAIAYGRVAELVHDAHRQIGLDPPLTTHGDAGERYDLAAMGWRLPCMIGHNQRRTLWISLADGSRLELRNRPVAATETATDVAEVMARYGPTASEAMGRDYSTDVDLAVGYFEIARAVFLRDGYHNSMVALFIGRKPVKFIQLNFENAQQKYAGMRELANEVAKTGADLAMLIGEAWSARPDQLKAYERPTDSPFRMEVLTLTLVSKSGEPVDLRAEIVREGESVSLGETQIAEGTAPFELASLYQAWGRPIPQSWIETANAAIAAAKTE